MKKLFFFTLLLIGSNLFAKKVKFSVDMTGITVLPTGMHVMGNFQSLAGFPNGDWQPNTTPLTREGTSDVYSTVVDIPAHRVYQYRYLNGDQTYESEFIPEESRVGWDFNDNRWIYVDSVANDTFQLPVLLFSGNAPAGKKMIRFRVDFSRVGIFDNHGIHVAGSFNNWNYAAARMCAMVRSIYEYTAYVDSNTLVEFRYANGNDSTKGEVVTGTCVTGGNRTQQVTGDLLLDTLCYGYCHSCESVLAVKEQTADNEVSIVPNPAADQLELRFGQAADREVRILDLTGREVFASGRVSGDHLTIQRGNWNNGLYLIHVVDAAGMISGSYKLMLQ